MSLKLKFNPLSGEFDWISDDTPAGFTEGSVIFADALGALAEDNSNFFWDDTNNRLGLGTATPLDTLHLIGEMEIDHTAVATDEHAIEIVCDAAGFGDIKALDVDYITGAIAQGADEAVLLVNIDESSATGGDVTALEVLTTEGSAGIYGMLAGVIVNPIVQLSGTFGNMDSALVNAVNRLTEFTTADPGGANNVDIFSNDNDTVTIGDAAQFNEIEFLLETGASGGGISPTFEYSTGVGTWGTFAPVDGTNGMRNSGVIAWLLGDIPSWAPGTGSEYLIRITRTKNSLSTVPKENKVQIASATEYKWDKDGVVHVKELRLDDNNNAFFGSSQDASIDYDGTNLVVDPRVVGSGHMRVNGAFALPIETVTTNTTLDETHNTLLVDCNGADKTITLPAASGLSGRIYTIKKIDSGSDTVTIDGNGSETIDGATTQVINIQYHSLTIACDGTSWFII